MQCFHLFATGTIRDKKLQLKDIDLKDKRVLIHTDFNVLFDTADPKTVTASARLQMLDAVPTIQFCLDKGAKIVILASHLDCQIFGPNWTDVYDRVSLEPVATALQILIHHDVKFLSKCVGPDVEAYCTDPQTAGVILLEKLPIYGQESRVQFGVNNDTRVTFYESFARLADVFIYDNFATADRCTSSMLGIGFGVRTFGFRMAKELNIFSQVSPSPSLHLVAMPSVLPSFIRMIQHFSFPHRYRGTLPDPSWPSSAVPKCIRRSNCWTRWLTNGRWIKSLLGAHSAQTSPYV